MEIFVWAFLGGIVGAVLMDIMETYAARKTSEQTHCQ